MFCSRLNNTVYIRVLSPQFSRCCTQVRAPWFNSLDELESSQWLADSKQMLADNKWPTECSNCKDMEEAGLDSVRKFGNSHHDALMSINPDYLSVGLEVDAKCNAACISCGPSRSSLFAKLESKRQLAGTGVDGFNTLDKDRILEIDLYGGESAVSNDTQTLLNELITSEHNVRKIRITTNASVTIPEIEGLLQRGIEIDISMSMDGFDKTFEYARWPIKWSKFKTVVDYYCSVRNKYLGLKLYFWTTHSALSLVDYDNMIVYSNNVGVPLIGSPVKTPSILHISHNNIMTRYAKEKLLASEFEQARQLALLVATETDDSTVELEEFLNRADALRKIQHKDYYANII